MKKYFVLMLAFLLCLTANSVFALDMGWEVGLNKVANSSSELSKQAGLNGELFLYFPAGSMKYLASLEFPLLKTESGISTSTDPMIFNMNLGADFILNPKDRITFHWGFLIGPSFLSEKDLSGKSIGGIGGNFSPFIGVELYTGSFIITTRLQGHVYSFLGDVQTKNLTSYNVDAGMKIYLE